MTVLVVEDDLDVLEVLAEALQAFGHEVLKAETCKRALEIAKSFRFDLVLCDMLLPDSEEVDLVAELRKRVNVPIVVVTGHSKAVGSGADFVLRKPFSLDDLAAALRLAF